MSDYQVPVVREAYKVASDAAEDVVNHPKHYNSDPSGVEAIVVCEHKSFCIGSAMKYLWRAGKKGGNEKLIEDYKKAVWYINREIERLSK